MNEVVVFTDNTVSQSPTWCRDTVLMSFRKEPKAWRRVLVAAQNARLALRSVPPGAPVVFGNTYPLSATLASIMLKRRRSPSFIVRLDPMMPKPNLRRRLWSRIVFGSVDILIVLSPSVAERYARYYRVPREKIRPLGFHHTLAGFDFDITEGDYVFAGGDSMRDYSTLIQAVEGSNIPVVIATRLPKPSTLPTNVTYGPVCPDEFRKLMAGARFIVLPLDLTQFRTSGQQTYLNAMALGKLIIVTDTEDAAFYIQHMDTGILTPTKDVTQLREAILWAWNHPDKCREIGRRARDVALPMDQEWTYTNLLKLVHSEYIAWRHNYGLI